jgi:hypothetical protein
MMDLTLIVVTCAALLLLLLIAWRRSTADDFAAIHDRSESTEYRVHLPERALLDRCLAREDEEFVAELRSPRLLSLLQRERRRLALGWLRQTRREASRLYRLHVRCVRHAADLQPGSEMKLLSALGLFLFICGMMMGMVWLSGPLRTRTLLQAVSAQADLLSRLGDRIAAYVAPQLMPELGAIPGGR